MSFYINDLDELRQHIATTIPQGLLKIKKDYTCKNVSGKIDPLTGWKDMRVVIVGNPKHGIRCLARADKCEGDIEIVVLRKDLELVGRGRLFARSWERIHVKSALWLEKNGLMTKRSRLNEKTDTFECLKGHE